MSLQIDWVALTPLITERALAALARVPLGANPLIVSPVRLTRLCLGAEPPTIAITRIAALSLSEQAADATFRYAGSAEAELALDVSANSCGNTRKLRRASRLMGALHTCAPLKTRCRVLVSRVQLCVRVEVRRAGGALRCRFAAPPSLSFAIDSNMACLGPIWAMALGRVRKIIRRAYEELPESIEIDPGALGG